MAANTNLRSSDFDCMLDVCLYYGIHESMRLSQFLVCISTATTLDHQVPHQVLVYSLCLINIFYQHLLQLQPIKCSSCLIACMHVCVCCACVCTFYSKCVLSSFSVAYYILLNLTLSHRGLQFFKQTKVFLPWGSLPKLIVLARSLLLPLLECLALSNFFFFQIQLKGYSLKK